MLPLIFYLCSLLFWWVYSVFTYLISLVYFVRYKSKYTSLLPRSVCLEYLLLWDILYLWLQQEDGICVTSTLLACNFHWGINNQWWLSPNLLLWLLFWWWWCVCFPTFLPLLLWDYLFPVLYMVVLNLLKLKFSFNHFLKGCISTSMLLVKHLIFPLRVLKVLLDILVRVYIYGPLESVAHLCRLFRLLKYLQPLRFQR